jgi:hypothetical protein
MVNRASEAACFEWRVRVARRMGRALEVKCIEK